MSYKRYTVSCLLCKSEVSTGSLHKHYNSKQCQSGGKAVFVKSDEYESRKSRSHCIFCNKECKTFHSLTAHEISCRDNPNKKISITENKRNTGGNAWNKGLTKETDCRVAANGKTLSENIASGKTVMPPPSKKSKEGLQRLRECAISRGLGGVRQSRKIEYNGVKLGSSYEVTLAISLDKNNIIWEIPKRIKYTDNLGKERTYTADFYLPKYDIYLDPKNDFLINNINPKLGFKDIDKIKWVQQQNDVQVHILNKTQLSWEYIATLL